MTTALFTSFAAPDSGVFESQVLEYGRFMKGLGLHFRYLLFEGLRTGFAHRRGIHDRIAALQLRFAADIVIHYQPSPLSRLGLRMASFRMRAALRGITGQPALIQARGAPATCAALELRRHTRSVRVIYDARGDETAEIRYEAACSVSRRDRSRWLRRAERMAILERRASAGADHILAVSEPLKEHVCAIGGAPPQRISVVPCCVSPGRMRHDPGARRAMRSRLAIEDRFVVVYSGSLTPYQLPDRMAALIEALRERLPQTHLLLLTRDHAGADRWFDRLSACGAVTVVDAPFDEVGSYLAAADAALLLRQDDAVNRVACPVKFAEYQICGLPVVTSPGIGDLSAHVRATGHGVVIPLQLSPREQAALVAEAAASPRWRDSEQIRHAATRRFCRDAYRDTYLELLAELGVVVNGRDPDFPAS